MNEYMSNISKRYVLMRILRFIFTFLVILTIIFILPRIAPGDPIQNILGLEYETATPEEIEYLKNMHGLNKGTFEQYIMFLKSIFTFDFGYSISSQRNVADMIAESTYYSTIVLLPALLIGAFFGFVAGLYGGTNKKKPVERALTSSSILMQAMPSFLVAMIALTVFSFQLGWFPLGHLTSGPNPSIFDYFYHLTLPVAVLGLMIFCGYYIMVRNMTLQIEDEYFIHAKRGQGFTEEDIKSKHISKNVSTQFMSMFAMGLGGIISGSIIVEIVFSLNGMGSVLFNAISFEDYPVIQGCFIFITFSILLANLIAEILYSVVDPRVGEGSST